jgi:glycosyltransferase involved in cell wall biosynthesis
MDATAEIVVVDNGSRDGTAAIARQLRCRVKRFEHPLGHDVGRAVGAALAAGDVCLFLDGDMVLEVVDMRAFVEAIESGVDVALNGYLGKVEKNRCTMSCLQSTPSKRSSDRRIARAYR